MTSLAPSPSSLFQTAAPAAPAPQMATAPGGWREIYNVRVYGLPVGQPRVRATVRRFGGKVHAGVYDPGTANDWKADIQRAFRQVIPAGSNPIADPLKIDIVVYFPRPKSHYGSGKNEGKLKPTSPRYHTGKPDRDNLDKVFLDALAGMGAIADDDQVCDGSAPVKLYVSDASEWKPGARIWVSVLEGVNS